MTHEQARSLVRVLEVAYPQSKRMREADTLTVYASMFEPLDYELAAAAVRDVIDVSKWWPAWSEIRTAYDERVAERQRRERREREQAERRQWESIDPSDDERRAMLELAHAFQATQWGTGSASAPAVDGTGQDGTGRTPVAAPSAAGTAGNGREGDS